MFYFSFTVVGLSKDDIQGGFLTKDLLEQICNGQ